MCRYRAAMPHFTILALAVIAIGLAVIGAANEGEHRSQLGAWLSSCNIRGNISRQTGERWFCTEEEARAAGWRKARR